MKYIKLIQPSLFFVTFICILGDSDSSEVTETLLSEAQEQALKNSVPEGEEEEEGEGEGTAVARET